MLGLGAGIGAQIALVVKSRKDNDLKMKVDRYIPGWAFFVDEIDQYNKSLVGWVSQKRKDFFYGGGEPEEKSVPSTKPTTVDKSKHDLNPATNETKEKSTTSTPLKSSDSDKVKQDVEPVSKVTDDVKKGLESSDDKQAADLTVPEQSVQEPPVEQKRTVEPARPQETERSHGSVAEVPEKQQEIAKDNIEPNIIKCLEEFSKACDTVADTNFMLSKTMEKARSAIALILLQPSPDYEKLAELGKVTEEATLSLKVKVEESYCSYCSSHQALLELVKEATGAGLDSLVSQARQIIFHYSLLVQSAEDRVRINQEIGRAFNSFVDAVKLTESELVKELGELDAPADVKAGLEETATLLLAERRIKLLYDKLRQLSPDEIAKSLENKKAELTKVYEEKMKRALDESRADMQERAETKVSNFLSLWKG